MIWPAVTRVSLFARAISFPASMAAMVGRIPIMPTTAVTTIWASGSQAASIKPSIPLTTFTSRSLIRRLSSLAASSFQRQAIFGWNSRTCFSKSSTLEPAASAVIPMSWLYLAISSVWVPMEPVEPRTEIFFIITYILLILRKYTFFTKSFILKR